MKPNETAFHFDYTSAESYRQFLAIRRCPIYRFAGGEATVPNEYVGRLGLPQPDDDDGEYQPHPRMFDYQRDITRLAVRKRKYAIFADCVAGESIIHCPGGDVSIEEACRIGKPLTVFAIKNGEVVSAQASAPWVNGYNDLYRFTFASGRSIIATMGHRFLSAAGWRRGSELRIGESLAVSEACQLRSNLGTSPSVSREDDQRSSRTAQDCSGRCSPRCHQCGGLPPCDRGIDQASFPSPADAHERSLMTLRSGVPASISGCIHRHQSGDRPSIGRCDRQVATMPEVAVCQPLAFGQACTAASSCIFPQADAGTIRQQQAYGLHPSGGLLFEADQNRASLPLQDSLIKWDTLSAVQYIRTDVFYDIEVPDCENYLVDGVWSHNCGLGKTIMLLDFARHCYAATGKRVMIVSPLMVVRQTAEEARNWYGEELPIGAVKASELPGWLNGGEGPAIGVTNYEAIREDLPRGDLGGLILDESSMLKSHYGAWGTRLIEMGRGVPWKLCCTGTPAPNDRIEFANHAVFLDRAKTANEFLASYFINRGQTQNRWELKPHAITPFYRDLSDWSIFLTNPATYGWKDNVGVTPPIHIHIETIDLTDEQRSAAQNMTGHLITTNVGGIGDRGKLSQIAKGKNGIATNKPEYIRKMVESWPDESTIIWCHYNNEQESMERLFPDAVSISGATPLADRESGIARFKSGQARILISKPKVLGFGLNLQICTRQVFSGIKDSYEEFYQAVKRSNRIGSTRPLNVHIPVTELEMPFVDNVLRKAGRVESDTIEQEKLFKEIGHVCFR